MGSTGEIHVVMLAYPLPGHINPMLDLSLKLVSKGVKVTFVNSEFNKFKMKLPSGEESDKLYSSISFLHIPDGLPPEDDHRDIFALLKAVDDSYGHSFAELLQNRLALQDPPITCIISNTVISHVQEVVHALGLPYVSFWPQSAASFASMLMVARGYRPPQDSQPFDSLPPGMLPGVPGLQIGELNNFLHSYNEEEFLYRLFTAPMQRIAEARCILMNTFEELEAETLAALREREHLKVLPIGPLLPQSFFDEAHAMSLASAIWESEDLDCISWLDKQEEASVIYVSFGSIASMSEEQLVEIALGLEASKQAFLWVVRPGMVVKAQEIALPKGFIERTAERGLVVSWAPQLRVLRHRAVAAFLTHCGWNSTLEGICGGVPLLCCPFYSDQPTNCRCAVDAWHVGLSLERSGPITGFVNRGEVEKKVVELTHGAQCQVLRAKARKWREEAVCGSSSLNLQCFIDAFQNVEGNVCATFPTWHRIQ